MDHLYTTHLGTIGVPTLKLRYCSTILEADIVQKKTTSISIFIWVWIDMVYDILGIHCGLQSIGAY